MDIRNSKFVQQLVGRFEFVGVDFRDLHCLRQNRDSVRHWCRRELCHPHHRGCSHPLRRRRRPVVVSIQRFYERFRIHWPMLPSSCGSLESEPGSFDDKGINTPLHKYVEMGKYRSGDGLRFFLFFLFLLLFIGVYSVLMGI